MSDLERRVHFDDLNWLGKSVFFGGAAVRFTAGLIDTVINRTVDIIVESEKAFKEGLDPTIEDAKILDEHYERRRTNHHISS